MTLQNTYAQYQDTGYPGQRANGEEWNGMSRIATADLPYGAPAQRLGDKQCSAFVNGGEFLGIVIRKHVGNPNADAVPQYGTAALADEGVYYATADAAITVGAALNWNLATGRYTTAATSGTILAVPGAEADSAAAGAGALFKLRLRRIPS